MAAAGSLKKALVWADESVRDYAPRLMVKAMLMAEEIFKGVGARVGEVVGCRMR